MKFEIVVIYALFYIVFNDLSSVPPRFLASGSAEIKDFEHGMASVKKISPDGGKSKRSLAMEGLLALIMILVMKLVMHSRLLSFSSP